MGQFILNRTISWTSALKATNQEDAATLAMLSDLQGNILKGHGRDNTINLFLTFQAGASAKVRAFLRGLGDKIPSALDQLQATQLFKTIGEDGGLFVAVFLSSEGYEALGLENSKPAGAAFSAGMKQRTTILSDPSPATWDQHFGGPVHALILLAHDDIGALAADAKALQQKIASLGGAITVLGQEVGLARRNKEEDGKHGIEHFGYVDGRSQPLMLDEEIENEIAAGGIDK